MFQLLKVFEVVKTSMPYLQSDQLSSKFLTLGIQSKLNLLQNRSNAAKAIECSNSSHVCTLSFMKHVLDKIF